MRATDEYSTIAAPARAELAVRSSRFIADAFPVVSAGEADDRLQSVKKEFHGATHHCWAYRIGAEQSECRSSDGGEPHGTAGKPILAALERKDVTNAVIIVTRYFGGIKLGTGGLARAYGAAAEGALDRAAIVTKIVTRRVAFSCDYEILPKVKSLIYQHGTIVAEEFGAKPAITCEIRKSKVETVLAMLNDAGKGRIEFRAL